MRDHRVCFEQFGHDTSVSSCRKAHNPAAAGGAKTAQLRDRLAVAVPARFLSFATKTELRRCVLGMVVTLEAPSATSVGAVPGARGGQRAALAGASGGGGMADERQAD
jgi:hypothetical protein